jgi:hypothetical protein
VRLLGELDLGRTCDRLASHARVALRLLVDALVIALMLVMLVQAPHIVRSQVGAIEMVDLERYSLSIPLFVTAALIALDFLHAMIKALTGRPDRAHAPVGDIWARLDPGAGLPLPATHRVPSCWVADLVMELEWTAGARSRPCRLVSRIGINVFRV